MGWVELLKLAPVSINEYEFKVEWDKIQNSYFSVLQMKNLR